MKMSFYQRLVTAVRLLLGAEFFVNGLNWWVKLITPYPSISDGVDMLPKGDFVAAMINTGIVFHLVKAVEIVAGIALLGNWFVPLALVAVFPITVNVFIADVFLHHKLRSLIMGSGAMLMNSFLMLAYLGHYRSMLVGRGLVDVLGSPDGGRLLHHTRSVLSVLSVLFGATMVGWVIVMIVQHFSG
jgi:hypothetical protein